MGPDGFSTISLWLAFLAADGTLEPVLVPIDGLPPEPHDGFIRSLARMAGGVLDGDDSASVALLLARPGAAGMTEADRRWARALCAAPGGLFTRWPIHLATPGRVQVFAPDDLVRAS